MRNNSTIDYLDIGSIASLPIRVPIVSLGSGQPVLSVLCGVHGDETASLMATYRLVQILSDADIEGTVRIITAANPFAQATHSRVAFCDYYDLNRTGKGKPEGTLTERLAHALFEFLLDCTLVVDLHEFSMNTPTMAIYIPSKHPNVEQTVFKGIAAFQPAFVWAMDLSRPEEVQYSGSLVAALARSGVASFGIETANAAVLSDEVISQVAEGLYRIAQGLSIIEGEPDVSPTVAYNREVVTANAAGLWEPTRSILDEVDETDTIGRLVSLCLTSEEEVASAHAGIILQLAGRQLVDTGTNLFAVGTVNQRVTEVLRSVVE